MEKQTEKRKKPSGKALKSKPIQRTTERTKNKSLKSSPKRAGAVKGPNKGEGAYIQLKIDHEIFPHIRALFSVESPQELEDRFGIKLDRDLPWPQKSKKTHSVKAGAILEMIARRSLKKGED